MKRLPRLWFTTTRRDRKTMTATVNPQNEEPMAQRFGIELPYTMTLRVRGVRPFLFSRMDIEGYDAEGGPGSKRKPRLRPEYDTMVWRTDDGQLAMPVRNLIASVAAAGKYFKSPISGNGSAKPTLLEGLVEGADLGSFGVGSWDVIDFRHARYADIKRSPKPTYRPRLEIGWLYEAPLAVTTPELYGPAKLLEIISRASVVMGIGDGRTIGMGRYVIDGYDLEEGLPW
jgi:hypothetical protein